MSEKNDKYIELSNEEVKKKLEAGEELKGCSIERFSLSKYEGFEKPIVITECKIGNMDLNSSHFLEEISVRRCDINTLVLSESTFQKKVNFRRSRIGRGRVQRAVFKDAACFEEAFLGYTSFFQSTFEQMADFSRTEYEGDATFAESTFKGDCKFIHGLLKVKGVFKKTEFFGKADFKHMDVGADLEFQDALFHGEVLLNGSLVKLDIDFSSATLEGKTDLLNVTAGRNIVLNDVKLGPNQGFRFLNASASSIVLKRENVEGHVFPENDGKYLNASAEYGFLRTAFQKINRFDDEDWAYYRFKKLERMGVPFSFHPWKLLKRGGDYFFLDLGCGYGTRPFRTFGMCGAMLLFFTLLYFFAFINATPPSAYAIGPKVVNQLFYAFDISLTAFSGGYGDLIGLGITGVPKLLAMIEYLLGVVFIGLFVVAFSRKVIR